MIINLEWLRLPDEIIILDPILIVYRFTFSMFVAIVVMNKLKEIVMKKFCIDCVNCRELEAFVLGISELLAGEDSTPIDPEIIEEDGPGDDGDVFGNGPEVVS